MKKGFTLLFAVLISSLLLSIGIAILSVTLKQLLLSSSGRESQFAFFAADTGQECAKYWDRHDVNGDLGTSVFPTSSASMLDGQTINCNGQPVSLTEEVTSDGIVTSFTIPDPCVSVTVTKKTDESTYVQSRGYNTCDSDDNRRTERAILSSF